MSQRRRTFLKRGLAVTAVAGGAGWYIKEDRDNRFWSDPPAFDSTGIETVTDAPVPTRPRRLPVSPKPLFEPFRHRIDRLLTPIPEPLSSDTLPNEAFRTRITERRAVARTAFDWAREARTPTEAREGLVTARTHACEAATVWAVVSSNTPVASVVPDRETVQTAIETIRNDFPGPAPSPLTAAGVYAALAAPVVENDRLRDDWPTEIAEPFEAGEVAGYVEQSHAHATAARLLARRYAETVTGESTASLLDNTAETLGDAVADRYRTVHRAATSETPTPRNNGRGGSLLDEPDTDTFVDTDVPAEAPSRELLRDRTWPLFDLFRGPVSVPFAWPDVDRQYPAVTVRQTHWLLTWLAALDSLRSRIREGRRLYPTDATQLRDRRVAAVDAVDKLAADGNSLERWVAWKLCDAFESPDDRLGGVTAGQVGDADAELDDGETVSLRNVADAYATYDWIVTVAESTGQATATVTDAVQRVRRSNER